MFTVQSPPSLPPLNGASDRERAIVATLLYYDLFFYPLRADELVRFVHRCGTDGNVTPDELAQRSDWWETREAFWFLRGREHLVERRVQLQAVSVEKINQARRWATRLQILPGVRFIGITGSLAMANAQPHDDIDLLVITARERLWLTRALVLSTLLAFGVKRADDDRPAHPNLICANIFLSEADLHIPDHNLFIAHEICQMLPLLGAETYTRFIQANRWVLEYLPQWRPVPADWCDRPALRRLQRAFEVGFGCRLGSWLERKAAARQLARIRIKHLRGHNTKVKVTPTQLRFHGRDLSAYIVNTFHARWQVLNTH